MARSKDEQIMSQRITAAIEKNAEQMERGRNAVLVESLVRDAIDSQMIDIIQSLMNIYRQGKMDHDVIVGKLGEYAGLDNLLAKLEHEQKRGNIAAEREFKNAAS